MRDVHMHMKWKNWSLCNSDPGSTMIPPKQLILKARHIRSDASRPGDLYAIAGGLHAKDVAMDVGIYSSLSNLVYYIHP